MTQGGKASSIPLPLYQYKPLPSPTSIRVLELLRGDGDTGHPHIELHHADRDDMLRCRDVIDGYEAVSYCWEGQTPTLDIQCHDSVLKVTPNVYKILEHLRKSHKSRYLWIDAVCLNQEDEAEKAIQVPLMGAIYQSAQKVHVWLGVPSSQDQFPELFAGFKRVAMLRDGSDKSEDEQLDLTHKELNRIFKDDFEAQMVGFFSRHWFSRRWILQECAMNTVLDVRCGPYKLAWSWFIKAVFRIVSVSLSGRLSLDQASVNALDMLYLIPSALDDSLLELLWSFPNSDCALAKDRIFSLMGMASDVHEFKDLKYGNDWGKTFAQVAAIYFRTAGNDAFKHLACFGSVSNLDVPSWVPDWRNKQAYNIRSDEDTRGGGHGWDSFFEVQSDYKLVIKGWYRGAIVWKDDSTRDPESRIASFVEMNKSLEIGDTIGLLARLLWAATRDIDHDPEWDINEEDLSADGTSEASNLRCSIESAIRHILDAQNRSGDENVQSNSIAEILYTTLGSFSLSLIGNPWWAFCAGPPSTQAGDLVFFYPHQWSVEVFTEHEQVYLGYVVRPEPGVAKLKQSENRIASAGMGVSRKTSAFTSEPAFDWEGKETARDCKFIGICFLIGRKSTAGTRVVVEIV